MSRKSGIGLSSGDYRRRPHSQVLKAQADFEFALKENDASRGLIWYAAQQAAATLRYWNATVRSEVAALLVPLIELNLLSVEILEKTYGGLTVALARKFIKWRRTIDSSEKGDEPFREKESALDLRFLYREVYRELPDLNFVLLLLAFQHAHLSITSITDAPSIRLASHTEKVLVPLTQMLGLWSLRRELLEKSLTRVCTGYGRIEKLLGSEQHTQAGFAEVLRREHEPTSEKGSRQKNLSLIDKAKVFALLTEEFKQQCTTQKIDPPPKLFPIRPFPGIVALRIKAGESEQDLTSRLSVRILCHDEEECYRVQRIVHRLGRPIAAKSAERVADYAAARFGDFIESPPPNGYSAIHTAIMYTISSEPAKEILTEFRILTPSMYRLNELGVVAALRRRPERYRNVAARWKLVSPDSDARTKAYQLDAETQAKIEEFELDTSAPPQDSLYVFSPHGEVRLLPSGSTALDFAYYIHSELAHHTTRIEVNGQEVPLNCPLRNGDLVRFDYDPHIPGPDMSWLGYITTTRARGNLRRGLTKRAKAIHNGRAILQDALERRLQFYRRHRQYYLTITEALLNGFLWRTAKARHYADISVIYDAIEAGTLSPDQLVRWLISEELADAVVFADGRDKTANGPRLLFCWLCHPTPGDEIEGSEHARGTITVHRSGECDAIEGARVRVPLSWIERFDPQKRERVVYQLTAMDRQGLLQDLLQIVYDEPKAYLQKVEADVQVDGNAEISLIVKADSWLELVELQAKLARVHDVGQLQSYPIHASQRFALNTNLPSFGQHPYTLMEVYDHRFMDREDSARKLIEWLSVNPPTDWFVLHGQERVGKTSLARYLQHQIVPQHQRDVLPVFFNMLILSPPIDADTIATHIVEAVYRAMESKPKKKTSFEVPDRGAGEEAFSWMKRSLGSALDRLKGRRLLIILDEFTTLCWHEERGHMDPSVFNGLRSVMAAFRKINWLLIAQENRFHDEPRLGNAAQIFNRARPLKLSPLDESWAHRLLVEPMTRCGITYEDEKLVGRLVRLTGGSPYFINWLGQAMVNRVNDEERISQKLRPSEERKITSAIVDGAVEEFMQFGDLHFRKLLDQVTGIRRLLLILIVIFNHKWFEVSLLFEAVQAQVGPVPQETLKHELDALERLGTVTRRSQGKHEQVSVTFDLFHRWLEDNSSLDEALQSCNVSSQTSIAEKELA